MRPVNMDELGALLALRHHHVETHEIVAGKTHGTREEANAAPQGCPRHPDAGLRTRWQCPLRLRQCLDDLTLVEPRSERGRLTCRIVGDALYRAHVDDHSPINR